MITEMSQVYWPSNHTFTDALNARQARVAGFALDACIVMKIDFRQQQSTAI
jgi:hypothetical protein